MEERNPRKEPVEWEELQERGEDIEKKEDVDYSEKEEREMAEENEKKE